LEAPWPGGILAIVVLTCLIVDDNAPFLKAAQDRLEREGVSVVAVASTGDQALAYAGALRPDVVLVDIDLGPESGFDVAKALARSLGESAPRVILISTYAEKDFSELIATAPARGFLSKTALSRAAIEDALSEPRDR
jgi:DNA-binding NarL/FixJ family response regulator